jgi:hypothetical protein
LASAAKPTSDVKTASLVPDPICKSSGGRSQVMSCLCVRFHIPAPHFEAFGSLKRD